MGDTAVESAPTTVSYAKIVDPAPAKPESQPAPAPAKEEDITKDREEDRQDGSEEDDDDDEEGFQQVTNKKVEKQREKEFLKKEERRKRRRNPRKFRKERERERFKEGEADKENTEKGDSVEKETSPPAKAEGDKEFIPAPPPKTNPWNKSKGSNNNDSSDKVKAEPRKKRNSERDTKETVAPAKPRSKNNPWKKVEVTSENDSPKVRTWPKLGEGEEKVPANKRVKGEKNWSGDSGAASSLETEEGKENQVSTLFCLLYYVFCQKKTLNLG